tara:strand:+ start:20 stop:772 length:753 start_codon:yes stop_codon:yes gene_type:complete
MGDESEPDLISSIASAASPLLWIKNAMTGVVLLVFVVTGLIYSPIVRWILLTGAGVMGLTAAGWIGVARYQDKRLRADLSLPRGDPEARLARREVLVEGRLNPEDTQRTIAELLFLDYQDSETPVTLIVDSAGGSVACGFALIDAVDDVACPVHTHCRGEAHDVAALIVAAGTPGARSAGPNSALSVALPAGSPAADEEPGQYERAVEATIAHLSRVTHLPEVQVAEDLRGGKRFSTDKAILYGLIDRVR